MEACIINNKRGIFFTLLTIIIISLFALSYTFLSNTGSRESVQRRIETLNSFVFAVEEDISRNLFVAGFRTTYITIEEIREGHPFRSNFTEVFNESFFRGTYDEVSQNLMRGATFNDVILNLQNLSGKINANVTIENASVFVDQEDPWNIRFNMNFRLKIWDLNGYVSWDKETIASAKVPTKYFDDPIYISETNGQYNVKVRETIFSNLSNLANLTEHVKGFYYVNHSDAPSFIKRLEGKFDNDSYGIESIIDLEKLQTILDEGENIENKSSIDHIYFGNTNPDWCNVVLGVRLDANHLAFYGLSCN